MVIEVVNEVLCLHPTMCLAGHVIRSFSWLLAPDQTAEDVIEAITGHACFLSKIARWHTLSGRLRSPQAIPFFEFMPCDQWENAKPLQKLSLCQSRFALLGKNN